MKNSGVPFAVFGGNTAIRSRASRRRNMRSTPRCWCGLLARNSFDTTTGRSASVGTGTTQPANVAGAGAPVGAGAPACASVATGARRQRYHRGRGQVNRPASPRSIEQPDDPRRELVGLVWRQHIAFITEIDALETSDG